MTGQAEYRSTPSWPSSEAESIPLLYDRGIMVSLAEEPENRLIEIQSQYS